jgi:hypothetical protein
MAVLYRPVLDTYNDKYNIEEYKAEGSEHFKDLPMDIVFGSMLFFYRLGIDLSKVMTSYLENNKEIQQLLTRNSVLNGVGISQFSHSLKEILQDLKISLN